MKRDKRQQQRFPDDPIIDESALSGESATEPFPGESGLSAANDAPDSPAQTGFASKQPTTDLSSEEESQGRLNFLDLTGLIRSIQRAEGNLDCFRIKDDCDQLDCSWRAYCLDGQQSHRQLF